LILRSLLRVPINKKKSVEGSYQQKADAVNEKFRTKHGKSTIGMWLKDAQPFDSNQGETA
jgi:stalled ribosome alternative rescue factor ArfA